MAGPFNPIAQKTKEEEERERQLEEAALLSPSMPAVTEAPSVADAMRSVSPEPVDTYSMGPEEFASQKAIEYGVPSYMTRDALVPPEPVEKPQMSVGQIMKIMGLSLIPVVGQAFAHKGMMNYRDQMGQYNAYQQQLQEQQEAQNKMIRDQMAKGITEQADWNAMVNTAQWFFGQGYSQDDALAYAYKWHKRDVPAGKASTQKPLMSKIATLTTGQTAEVFQDTQTGVVYAVSPAGPQKVPATLIKSLRDVGEEATTSDMDKWEADRAMKFALYNRDVLKAAPGYVPNDLDYALAEKYWKEKMGTESSGSLGMSYANELIARGVPKEQAYRQAITETTRTSGALAEQRADVAYGRKLRTQFSNSPSVKRFLTGVEGIDFSSRFSPQSQNPADHQAMIYAFAKVMDPDSVVREGEYKTVQKYAQAWKEAVGLDLQRIIDNKGILTAEAIQRMQQTMRTKFDSLSNQVNIVREEYGRQIDQEEGTTGATATLPDYVGGYGKRLQSKETKYINGVPYEKGDDGKWRRR